MQALRRFQFTILVSLVFAAQAGFYLLGVVAGANAAVGESLGQVTTLADRLQGLAGAQELPNDLYVQAASGRGGQYAARVREALGFLRMREVGDNLPEEIEVLPSQHNTRLFPGVRSEATGYAVDFKEYYGTAANALVRAIETGNAALFDAIGTRSTRDLSALHAAAQAGTTPWFLLPAQGFATTTQQKAFVFEDWAGGTPLPQTIPMTQLRFWIQREVVAACRDAGVRMLEKVEFPIPDPNANRSGATPTVPPSPYYDRVQLQVTVRTFFHDVPRLLAAVNNAKRNFLLRDMEVSDIPEAERSAVRDPGPEGISQSPVKVTLRIEDVHYRWDPALEPPAAGGE